MRQENRMVAMAGLIGILVTVLAAMVLQQREGEARQGVPVEVWETPPVLDRETGTWMVEVKVRFGSGAVRSVGRLTAKEKEGPYGAEHLRGELQGVLERYGRYGGDPGQATEAVRRVGLAEPGYRWGIIAALAVAGAVCAMLLMGTWLDAKRQVGEYRVMPGRRPK